MKKFEIEYLTKHNFDNLRKNNIHTDLTPHKANVVIEHTGLNNEESIYKRIKKTIREQTGLSENVAIFISSIKEIKTEEKKCKPFVEKASLTSVKISGLSTYLPMNLWQQMLSTHKDKALEKVGEIFEEAATQALGMKEFHEIFTQKSCGTCKFKDLSVKADPCRYRYNNNRWLRNETA